MEPTEKQPKGNRNNRNVWPKDQIDLLLEAWEEKIQDLRGNRRNAHVLEEIRVLFKERNFTVTTAEIKNRINNLTARYRQEKRDIGPSGGKPSTWPYYDRVHSILGSFRINNVSDVVEESISDDNDMQEEWLDNQAVNDDELNGSIEIPATPSSSSSSSSSTGGRSAAKKRKLNVQQEMLDELKRNNALLGAELERLRETDEKLIELEEERNQVLRDMAESTKEFNGALITFITK